MKIPHSFIQKCNELTVDLSTCSLISYHSYSLNQQDIYFDNNLTIKLKNPIKLNALNLENINLTQSAYRLIIKDSNNKILIDELNVLGVSDGNISSIGFNSIKNDSGITQFTASELNKSISFASSGTVSISFDQTTNKIIISGQTGTYNAGTGIKISSGVLSVGNIVNGSLLIGAGANNDANILIPGIKYNSLVINDQGIPSWGTVNLSSNSAVSGILPISGGGTGLSNLGSLGIAILSYSSSSSGFVSWNGSSFSINTSTYLTSNQSITLSGDVSGSGTTSISVSVNKIKGNTVPSNLAGVLYNDGNGVLSWVTGLPPSGSVSGDLAGSLPNPTVIGIQGKSITLSIGFLKYNGTSWIFDNSSYLTSNQSITLTTSGDVSGSASGTTSISPSLTVTGIQGKSITLSLGFLKYNGASWIFDNSNYITANQSITWTSSGDISGSASGTTSISPSLTVTGIQGKSITLASGLLRYNGTVFSFDSSTYITLTSISATSPILYNNTTGVISHSTADGSLHVPATGTTNSGKVLTAGATAGALNWTTPTTGTVTSVGLSAPSIFTVSGSPVTSTGTLSFAFNGTSTNFLLADGTTVARSTYAAASDLTGYLPLTAGSGKALTGVLYGTGLNFTTTSDSPLLITHNLAGAFTHPLQAFNSGMVAGNQYNFDFGQAAANYNAGNFGFKYVGAGSTSNYITLGLYGANDLLKITGSGIATFSGSVVTPALSIGSLSGLLIGTSGVVSATTTLPYQSTISITTSQISNWSSATGAFPTGSGTAGYVPLWSGVSTLGNSSISDNATLAGVNIANTRSLFPTLSLSNSSQGTNAKNWAVRSSGSSFVIDAFDDGWGSATRAISIDRSGTTISNISLQSASINLTALTSAGFVKTNASGLLSVDTTAYVTGGPYLPLAGGTMNTGAQIITTKDITPAASSNTNYLQAPLVANRASTSGTTTVAAVGFHNQGVNAAALYYVPSSDPAQSFFKYNRHIGDIVTIWDSSNLTNLNQLTNGPGYITNATAANINVNEHSTNDIEYPVVWDNGARSLFHTSTKFLFNPYSGRLRAPHVYATTYLSWGGGWLQDLLAEPNYTAIYGSTTTPSTSPHNYGLAVSKAGTDSWLNGTTSSNLAVGGNMVARATSTGLTVNGTLTASGIITSGLAAMGTWTVSPGNFAWFGANNQNNGTNGNSGFLQANTGPLYACAPNGADFNVQISGVNKLTINSTLSSISNNLSVSGTINALKIQDQAYGPGDNSSKSAIYGLNVSPTSSNYSLLVRKDGTYTYMNGTIQCGLDVNNIDILVAYSDRVVASYRIEAPTARFGIQRITTSTYNLVESLGYYVLIMPNTGSTVINLPSSPSIGCAFMIFGNRGENGSTYYATGTINSASNNIVVSQRTSVTFSVANSIPIQTVIIMWDGSYWYTFPAKDYAL